MTDLLALVPAKGNSERFPSKNLYPFGGVPLVRHTAEFLVSSSRPGLGIKTVVVTDSDDVIEAVKDICEYVKIPASGRAVTDCYEANKVLKERLQLVGMFLPTAPLRTTDDLEKCVEYASVERYDSAITVTEFDFPPALAISGYGEDELDLQFPVHYLKTNTRSQDFPKSYRPNGMCYVARWKAFHVNKHFFGGRVRGVPVKRTRMVDIDYKEDLLRAEELWKRMRDSSDKSRRIVKETPDEPGSEE